MNGTAASAPTMMQVAIGVCSRGLTFAIALENGSWSSRAIPNASRMVDVRMAMQQTKIAADTTSRYSVVPAWA